jgi:hypothetical protein
MSSPIHHTKDVDITLIYAPPWARDPKGVVPAKPATPAVERTSRHLQPARDGFSGDRAMSELQRKLALNPNVVPEPASESSAALWPLALRICAVTGVSALVAWGVILLPSTRRTEHDTAQADVPAAPPPSVEANRVKLVRVQSEPAMLPPPDADAATKNDARLPLAAPPPVQAPLDPIGSVKNDPRVASVEALPVTAETAPAPSTGNTVPAPSTANTAPLSADEIAMMVKRGKTYLMNGDLVLARLLLRRAAEAGSADGALALGATFDPLVIQRLGVVGEQPDLEQARKWYQAAALLGSQAASQQLAKLAQIGQ